MPSGPEWIIVLVIALLIFGGSNLPKLARNLGKAQTEFKAGLAQGEAEAASGASTATTRAQLEGEGPTREGLAESRDTPPTTDPAETITVTRAELDRLIDERLGEAHRQTPNDDSSQRREP